MANEGDVKGVGLVGCRGIDNRRVTRLLSMAEVREEGKKKPTSHLSRLLGMKHGRRQLHFDTGEGVDQSSSGTVPQNHPLALWAVRPSWFVRSPNRIQQLSHSSHSFGTKFSLRMVT